MRIRIRISINQIIIRLLFLFPLGTVISNVPGIGNIVNKVLYAFFIVSVLVGLINKPLRKIDALALVLLTVMFIYDLMITGNKMYNSNEVYYLVTWVVYLIYVRINYENFKREICNSLPFIKSTIILWNLLVGVSLLLPSCWARSGAFYSFAGGQHRMDSAAVMVLAGTLILYRYLNYRKSIIVFTIVPCIAVIFSGARTYLLVVGIIMTVYYYYINIEHPYRFWLTIIPILIVAMVGIMSTSVMQERIATMETDAVYFSSKGYNALTGITSGRSMFWLIDLEKYWESPLVNQILGNGFNFVRYVNKIYYKNAIWAHNDFINIICCNGVIGLCLYFFAYFKMVQCSISAKMSKKVRRFMLAAFHICCMGNAMFNMLYSYFAAALAVPVLLFAMMDCDILPERKIQ